MPWLCNHVRALPLLRSNPEYEEKNYKNEEMTQCTKARLTRTSDLMSTLLKSLTSGSNRAYLSSGVSSFLDLKGFLIHTIFVLIGMLWRSIGISLFKVHPRTRRCFTASLMGFFIAIFFYTIDKIHNINYSHNNNKDDNNDNKSLA